MVILWGLVVMIMVILWGLSVIITVILWGLAAMRMETSLLETGKVLMTSPVSSSPTRNPTPGSGVVSCPLYQSLWPSSAAVSPKPIICYLRGSRCPTCKVWSRVSSCTLLHWLYVRTFHVTMAVPSVSKCLAADLFDWVPHFALYPPSSVAKRRVRCSSRPPPVRQVVASIV